jgi:hypothetical protein
MKAQSNNKYGKVSGKGLAGQKDAENPKATRIRSLHSESLCSATIETSSTVALA